MARRVLTSVDSAQADFEDQGVVAGLLANAESATAKTIAGGVVNVSGLHHVALTGEGAASDTLDRLTGGANNQFVVLRNATTSTITLNGAGTNPSASGTQPVSLTSSLSDANATSYATASITPPANQLILAAVHSMIDGGTPAAPTLTGNGLTWVQVATQNYYFNALRVTLFRAMGSAPTSGAVTIDFGGVTQSNCTWSVYSVDGVLTTGSNGSGAVVQSAAATGDSSTPAATLGAFANAANATFAAVATVNSTFVTPGTGYTELVEQSSTDVLEHHLELEWRADNDTSVDATTENGFTWGIIAIELATDTSSNVGAMYGPGLANQKLVGVNQMALALYDSSAGLWWVAVLGGPVYFSGPTADPHVVGQVWANTNVLTVSTG